ncbi:MAG: M15 family metallopeptidase [Candidatus Saccharimonadota bacterium]
MPAPTLPGDEKQGQKYDVHQAEYDRRFNDIAQAEEKGTFDDIANNYDKTAEESGSDKLRQSEGEGGSGGWKTDMSPDSDRKGLKERFEIVLKRFGPALGIGGTLSVGGIIIVILTSPSILFFQLNSTMVDKFNTQLGAMEVRSNRLFSAKINSATSGFCTNKVTIKCKFTTMSQKQVDAMKKAGITVNGEKNTFGRTKPTSYTYDGKDITPAQFASEAKSNPGFRSALRSAYNPKYAGFVGKAWASVATHFKITKQAPDLSGADEEEARRKLQTIASEGFDDTGSDTGRVVAGEPKDPNCTGECDVWTEDEARAASENSTALKESADDGSAANKVRSTLSGINNPLAAAGSFLKITGIADSYCTVYGGLNALTYAAKAIRAAQLVRYMMIFMSVSDAIKAGKSPPEKDVALLGSILTSTVKDPNDATKTLVGSATDSYGYKYAAYGDVGASTSSLNIANRFMAGGGLVGEISVVSGTVMSYFPGGRKGAKDTCGVLANPVVQGVSILAGIGALFIPGANAAKIIASGAVGVAVGVTMALLPGLLADIVAGSVTDDIMGEEAGNAITSGSGKLLSDSLAAQNGNAPMTKEDAIAYNSIQTQTTNQYIADEVRETSPFDTSNPHTFLGSITSSLIPLRSSSNPLTVMGSLLSSSIKNVIPTSNAVTTEQYAKSLEVCNDLDVQEGGYAADPFCNVTRGIPPKYLNKDPLLVVDELVAAGDLSEDGVPQSNYSTFITECIESLEPLGYSDSTDFDVDEVKRCIINDSNANYYVHYMDQRIELGMSQEDVAGTSSSSLAGVSVDMAYVFEDSTGVGCAPGTDDAGTTTGYKDKKPIPIRLCSIPNTSKGGAPVTVNSRVSGAFNALITQMRTDLGITGAVNIADGFREMSAQEHAWRCANGRPQPGEDCSDIAGRAAEPGTSNHQMGVAIDFQLPTGNRGATRPGDAYWDWLSANASKWGYSSNVGESWHWSVTGG